VLDLVEDRLQRAIGWQDVGSDAGLPGFVPVGHLHNREQPGIMRTDQTYLRLGEESSLVRNADMA
jgi:hypothetical protein